MKQLILDACPSVGYPEDWVNELRERATDLRAAIFNADHVDTERLRDLLYEVCDLMVEVIDAQEASQVIK